MPIYAAETERLWLQILTVEEHFEDLHLIHTNPFAMMWSTKKTFTEPQQTLQLMLESMPTAEKPWNQRWAILLKSQDAGRESEGGGGRPKPRMIGIMGIVREAELGYKLHPDFWGKGYMSEALRTFIDMWWRLESSAKYDRLLAAADPENIGSMRVLEKAGFRKEEIKKGFYKRGVLDGKESDLQCFSLDRPRVFKS